MTAKLGVGALITAILGFVMQLGVFREMFGCPDWKVALVCSIFQIIVLFLFWISGKLHENYRIFTDIERL